VTFNEPTSASIGCSARLLQHEQTQGRGDGFIPVQAPTKHHIAINLKVHQGDRNHRSAAVLARADEVIE